MLKMLDSLPHKSCKVSSQYNVFFEKFLRGKKPYAHYTMPSDLYSSVYVHRAYLQNIACRNKYPVKVRTINGEIYFCRIEAKNAR